MKIWTGIMQVLEINHFDNNKKLLYQEKNIKNMIHYAGEEFILKILFAGESVPSRYYIGLDSRSSLNISSQISDVFGLEPNQYSYERQQVESNGFSISVAGSGHRRADSPTLIFRAIGGSWGPVRNVFLATNLGYNPASSILISSATLSRNITVSDGEIITMKMGMALSSC
jgi:hypothetical protein